MFAGLKRVLSSFKSYRAPLFIFLFFSALYIGLAWVINGGDRWWLVDFVKGANIYYGDDAYRFFLARSAWLDSSIYTYNFDLPVNLLLENVVVTLAGGSLFWSRCLHALLGAASLCLVWSSGLRLGINRSIMAFAVLVMGLMPLYALVSLSFYGEAWLGFALCAVIWLFLGERMRTATLLVGLLPLIRPEGIFFLLPFGIYLLRKGHWRECLLLLMPGILYFVFLLIKLPDIHDYVYWRIEERRMLAKIIYKNDWTLLPGTYSLLLTVPAFLGLVFPPVRRLWPFLVGAFFWSFLLQVGISFRGTSYEPRYAYSLIPFLIILWAGALAWLWGRAMSRGRESWEGTLSVSAIALLLIVLHLGQLTLVTRAIDQKGLPWMVGRVVRGEWERIFPSYLPDYMSGSRQMSGKIEELLAHDSSIDRLAMFDSFLYYYLDPRKLPSGVRVDYPIVGYLVFHFMLNGQVFTQHPGGKMYSYFRFGKPDFKQGESRALYVDKMPMPAYPFRWDIGPHQLYLFSYEESLSSGIDLDKVPDIDPAAITALYERVFPGQ